jgi:hypothetical protein
MGPIYPPLVIWLVSQKLLHVELGCMPVSFTGVKMACGFWNRLVTQRSSMLHSAFAENLDMSINDSKRHMWCGEMLNCLKDVVPDYFDTVTAVVRDRLAISTIRRVDVEVVLGQWGSRWIDCWRDRPTNPRVASSEQVCHATYDAWMSQCISQPAPYVDYDKYIHPEHLADLMRIRLGCHWLNV